MLEKSLLLFGQIVRSADGDPNIEIAGPAALYFKARDHRGLADSCDALLRDTGEKLAHELEAAGLDVLLDDRDERAGVKFKDADLVGIPYRINVGKKAAEGKVELVTRATATSVDVALPDVVQLVKQRVEEDALRSAVGE